MKYWSFIGLLLLTTGCDQYKKLVGRDDTPLSQATGQPPAPVKNPAPIPAPTYHVFITDGQSNMVGTHHTIDYPPLPHFKGQLRGPGYAFAKAYLDRYPDRYIQTIQCAGNGSSIVEHQEGAWLFEGCLENIRQEKASKDQIEGLLWWQGEADASTGMDPNVWANYFTAYINAMRRRTNKPNLPVIYVQLGILLPSWEGTSYTAPTWDAIKTIQATFYMPQTAWVKSEDLTLVDYVHYDMNSYLIIGERLFNAFQGVL